MQQQIITPQRRPVRRHDRRDLERIECAYRVQGRASFGSAPNDNLAVGGGGPAPGPTDPVTIVTSHPWQFFYSADVGYTPGTWVDNSASALNATQATAANQPSLISAGLNGKNYLQCDGMNDNLAVAGWNPNAPGTTNCWFWGVLRQHSWVAGFGPFGCSSTILACKQITASPQLCIDNTTSTATTSGGTIGTFFRVEAFFANATSDYIKAGSVASATGTSAGNANAGAGAFRIGSLAGASLYCQADFACFGCVVGGLPTGTEISNLNSWVTSYYGGGVLV